MTPVRSYEEVFQCVEANQGFLIDTLRALLRVDTCVPPGANYASLIEVMEPLFQEFGFETERVVIPWEKVASIPLALKGDRINLVARRDRGLPPVSIYGHMDTVPVEGVWKYDPFGGESDNGCIYGRGTADMKGAIACLLTALKVMTELDLEPKFDIRCLLCTDEEVGVYPGAYHLALEGYFRGQLIWLELGWQGPIILQAAAGMVDTEVTVVGRSCHSGLNFFGINAVEEAVPILNELLLLKKEVEIRQSQIALLPLVNAPCPNMTPMLNIDIISGGSKSNVVPGSCRIVVNRRYIPEEQYENVVSEIEEAVRRGAQNSKALEVNVKHLHAYKPVVIDVEGGYVDRAKRARRLVHGFQSAFVSGGLSGSTDMGFVTDVLGTKEVIAFGPCLIANTSYHAADEHVTIDGLVGATKELLHYLTS